MILKFSFICKVLPFYIKICLNVKSMYVLKLGLTFKKPTKSSVLQFEKKQQNVYFVHRYFTEKSGGIIYFIF